MSNYLIILESADFQVQQLVIKITETKDEADQYLSFCNKHNRDGRVKLYIKECHEIKEKNESNHGQ